MKVSQKGSYALQALALLAHRFDGKSPTKIHDIATADGFPEKFLEFILPERKLVRVVESVRGAKGGYRLKRLLSEIFLGEIIRTIDGPLAPFEDAELLRRHVKEDSKTPFSSLVVGSECCGRDFGPHLACGCLPFIQVADGRRVET